MASSPAASLTSRSMPPSPSQLTPRSRVKAMLAKLDDESDGEVNIATKDTSSRSRAASKATSMNALERSTSTASNETPSTDEDEEDKVVYKPRGKLAARMLAVHSDTEEDADQGPRTARDRVRKLLMAEKQSSPKDINTQDNSENTSDSDPSVAVSRRPKMRQPRRVPPMSSPSTERHVNGEDMFVSPTSSKPPSPPRDDPSSEDDLPANPNANARFLALVEKKRQERLAREKDIQHEKAQKAAERAILSKNHSKLIEDDVGGYSDDEDGRQLTQQVRPTRKASKKALEEMHRETQRMSRNMQLAHQAKTKKKITKSSLFAKFNYKPAVGVENDMVEESRPASSSSAPQTDAEMKDTPPTSPMSQVSDAVKDENDPLDGGMVSKNGNLSELETDEFIPTLQDALSQNVVLSLPIQPSKVGKGKGKAVEEIAPNKISLARDWTAENRPPLSQIRHPEEALNRTLAGNDSDSDLEIVPIKTTIRKQKESVFDRVPAKQARESHSLHALRMLAHITSPGNRTIRDNAKKSVTAVELQMSLQQRARQQATREREERMQALRAKGVMVQTADEREKEMADMEDLVAKARREGEEIMKREKDAAKKERKANGEVDPLGDGSDDDEEWEEEKENFSGQVSGSGSESERDDEGDASGEEEDDEEDEEIESADEENIGVAEPKPKDMLIDDEASESESAVEQRGDTQDDDSMDIPIDGNEPDEAIQDEDDGLPLVQARRRTRHLVVSDDEEDPEIVCQSPMLLRTDSPMTRRTDSPNAPPSVLRSATKTFIPGVTVAGPAGLGLTQIFAGTMDDTQPEQSESYAQSQQSCGVDVTQDSMAFLRRLPPPVLPSFEPTFNDHSQEIIGESQTQISQIPESPVSGAVSQGIQLHFSQSEVHGFDSMLQYPMPTQLSEYPDPTQDAGFQAMSPIKGRFVELAPSTVDTVVLQQTPQTVRIDESPVARRKGKLRRRNASTSLSDNEEIGITKATAPDDEDEFSISADIFDVMRKTRKTLKQKQSIAEDFDKKKSGAKEMVQEQAEESEDEYAGLGGASDDESGGEEDAFVKEIIDDEVGKDADERQLAAFYADKERASDEKQIEKLYKDITNGMLRRKRGADYDLSDSDDGGEARRRMKRKEFSKMRKALLEDERIGKIAENPKKMAFLRAIEDRGDEDEMDFLEDLGDDEEMANSQSQSQADPPQKDLQRIDDSQPEVSMGLPKRKLSKNAEFEKRLPPHLRRTNSNKRPSNLSEIRESLSSLIEEPNSIVMSHDSSGSDSELEIEGEGLNARESHKEKENLDPFASRRKTSIAVVDRISLKREASNTTSSTTRLAFAAPSSTPGFKVPALLRRTTTNNSISSGSSLSSVSSTERMAGAFRDDSKVAKKAGKNSGVHYFARENERKMRLEEVEKRRSEKRWKGAEGRRKVVGGLFGKGKFE